MADVIGLEEGIYDHLSNTFLATLFDVGAIVQMCKDAIDAFNRLDFDYMVSLPEGVELLDKDTLEPSNVSNIESIISWCNLDNFLNEDACKEYIKQHDFMKEALIRKGLTNLS